MNKNLIDYAERWLTISLSDLNLSKKIQNEMPDQAAYHAQQSIEKSLKAFLVLHQQKIEKTHDVSKLMLCAARLNNSFLELDVAGKSDVATSWATYFRYPNSDEVSEPEPDELDAIIDLAERTLDVVSTEIDRARQRLAMAEK